MIIQSGILINALLLDGLRMMTSKKSARAEYGGIDDESNMQLSSEIVIPTSCVLSVKRLTEVTCPSSAKVAASRQMRQPS